MSPYKSIVDMIQDWTQDRTVDMVTADIMRKTLIDPQNACRKFAAVGRAWMVPLLLTIGIAVSLGLVSGSVLFAELTEAPSLSGGEDATELVSIASEIQSTTNSGLSTQAQLSSTISVPHAMTDDRKINDSPRNYLPLTTMTSDDPNDSGPSYIEIRTTATIAEYHIEVTGMAEPGDNANTHEHEYRDSVQCDDETCVIHGFVANGGLDDFLIQGEIVGGESDEPITVSHNGEEFALEELLNNHLDATEDNESEADERHLEILTDTVLAEYRITIEGSATPGDRADAHEHEYQDTVTCAGDSCVLQGYVANGGVDDFFVTGSIVAIESDEPISVFLDDEEISIDDLSAEGLDRLDRIGPNEDITVEPGSSVLFQVATDDPNAITWENDDAPILSWVDLAYLLDYGMQTGTAVAIVEFDEEGTYEIRATDENGEEVTWMISAESGGMSAPTIDEFVSEPHTSDLILSDEEIEFIVTASNSDSELVELIWFEGGMDELLTTTAVEGVQTTTSASFSAGNEFFEHSPIGVRAIDDQNLISEEVWEWAPTITSQYSVTIVETNSPVKKGETLEVTVEVINNGNEVGEDHPIALDVDGHTAADTALVSGLPGEPTTVTLTYETNVSDIGDFDVTVRSLNDEAMTQVTVNEPTELAANFVTCSAAELTGPLEFVELISIVYH